MKIAMIAAAMALLGAVATSHAADLSPEPVASAPVVSSAPSWTGAYLGAQAGYSWGNAPSPDQSWTATAEGAKLGLFAGYNYDLGGAVIGGEVGGNWLNATGNVATGSAGETYKLDQNWDASLVARLGIPVDDSILLYGLAGGSVTGLTGQYVETVFPQGPAASNTVWGWTVGAGLEHRLSDNVSLRGEYRYASYGNADLTCSVCGHTSVNLGTNSAAIGVLAHW